MKIKMPKIVSPPPSYTAVFSRNESADVSDTISHVGKSAIQRVQLSPQPPASIGFHLKGLNILKVFMDSTYYSLVLSYTFKWEKASQRFKIIEFLPQRVICALMTILILIHFICMNWNAVYQVSSRKKDLKHCFVFVRHISTVITYATYLYTAICKRKDFINLLQFVSRKVISGETNIVPKVVRIGVPFLFLLLYTAIFLNGLAPVFLLGVRNAALMQLNNWVDESSKGFPSLRVYLPETGSWSSSILTYVVLLVCFQSTTAFWAFIVFILIFILFVRCNLKSFKKFVENLEIGQSVHVYEEYLYVKELVDLVNAYIGPRIFALFFSLVPFFSYFLSSFSDLAEEKFESFLFFCFWATTIWTVFFIAADTSTLTGEIKRALMIKKRKLDQLCGGGGTSSDLSAILMDMPNGNELGISCLGWFIIDYSLIGSMLGSIFTFAIILIQADDE